MRLRWKQYWALGLLCLLTASRWLFENANPASASTSRSEAVGLFLAAIVPGAMAFRLGKDPDPSKPNLTFGWLPFVGVVLIFTGSALAGTLAGRAVGANDAALALVLSPVVAALASRARSDFPEVDLTRLVWPSLAGATALLLLVPQPSFQEARGWLSLGALTLLLGLGAVLASIGVTECTSEFRPAFELPVFVGMLVAALVFICLPWAGPHKRDLPILSWSAAALDGTQALLTVLALRRLGAYRWTTQFLLVPLLGILEGVVLLRPTLDGRLYAALILLGVSSVYQLFFAQPVLTR